VRIDDAFDQHLDLAAAVLDAVQAGVDDAGVVEDQQVAGWPPSTVSRTLRMVAPSFLAILSSTCCAWAAEKPPEKREPKVRKSSFLGLVKGALNVAMNCVSSLELQGQPLGAKEQALTGLGILLAGYRRDAGGDELGEFGQCFQFILAVTTSMPLRLELLDRLLVELLGDRLNCSLLLPTSLIETSESAPIIASRPLSDFVYFSSVTKSTM
jgi:hypothetical protein